MRRCLWGSCAVFLLATAPLESEMSMKSLFAFGNEEPAWRIIDDGVMGGLSRGEWMTAEGIGVFQGTLSLENNGGFSSVRSAPLAEAPGGATAFRLRVKGDGRTYQFRARTDANFDGVSYRAEFATRKGEWQEIMLPLADFAAVFRGRVLKDLPPLTGKEVVTVGFLLGDKVAGEFRLEVDWIKAEFPEKG